jgi:hypothetical protein
MNEMELNIRLFPSPNKRNLYKDAEQARNLTVEFSEVSGTRKVNYLLSYS